ncbi:MAG TPA: DUF4230 domain-containing protein [Tepidisphaeraceae bacterium]|jgi:hypothetical protein|nr:DUF4230 domain-containing protein [Tepidisphaeraceae bacterium]
MFHLRRIDWIALFIVAIAVAMPLLVIRFAIPTRVPTKVIQQSPPPPTAQVLSTTRELKLLTVSIESTVTTTRTDDNWRGTASATIQLPVKYHFGVDLSKINDHNLSYNPLTQTQTLTIPPPSLLAIEVDGSHPITERIDVTGLRFKKLSGAEQLNLAQKSLYEAARKQTLPQKDLDQIRLATRTQIEASLARIVGSSTRLRVKFVDE